IFRSNGLIIKHGTAKFIVLGQPLLLFHLGLYHRLNLNMPPRLPVREDIIDHTLDSPLTQIGLFVAGACGRALAESGVRFSACYVSPALRCVQTACHLLKAAGQVMVSGWPLVIVIAHGSTK
ncbi:unnamed protein product, partial [Hymenolepis diminuta]|uniref:NAD(P)-bd_dom domain-containing protein n=1 Tax=Hymenolepis diminuta TaxID=6216 RepID=A0A0R3SD57_HYMDI